MLGSSPCHFTLLGYVRVILELGLISTIMSKGFVTFGRTKVVLELRLAI